MNELLSLDGVELTFSVRPLTRLLWAMGSMHSRWITSLMVTSSLVT